MLLETTPESTGSLDLNTNTDNLEDLPQLVNPAEVSELKVISMQRPDLQEEPTIREETKLNLEDTDDVFKCYLK